MEILNLIFRNKTIHQRLFLLFIIVLASCYFLDVYGQKQVTKYSRLNISVIGESDSLIEASLMLWDKYLLNKGNNDFKISDYWSKSERGFFSDEWVDGRYRYLDYSKRSNATLFYKPLILSAKREAGRRVLIKTLFYGLWPESNRLVVTKIIDIYNNIGGKAYLRKSFIC